MLLIVKGRLGITEFTIKAHHRRVV